MRKKLLVGIFLVISSAATAGSPPATKTVPVESTYHGVTVRDNYQWLEDWQDPTVRRWSQGQNARTRGFLDNLPDNAAIGTRVTEILSAETVSFSSVASRSGRFFAIKRQPPKQQPFLVVVSSLSDLTSEAIVLDPNMLDSTGHTSIDWYVPSHSGQHVAVSLSQSGSEAGDVHIFEVSTGKEVFEVIPRVNGGTAGGDLAWLPDDSGFYYTRYPRGDERPTEDLAFYQQVYFHKLGTPTAEDRYELGEGLPRIAEIQLDIDSRTGRLLATVQDGDGGEFAHFLRSRNGGWRQFSEFGDRIVQACFGMSDDLYAISRRDAPNGKILRLTAPSLDAGTAETIVPQGDDSIVTDFWSEPTVMVTDRRLYVTYQLGGPSEIRVFDHSGKRLPGPQQAPVSAVGGMARLADDAILFRTVSFVQPATYYRYAAEAGTTEMTVLAATSPVRFEDAAVVREFATSKDGTKVPISIIMPKGTRQSAANPCLVTGYGGYGVNIEPRFRATVRLLLDQGFIYAVANLRGGGEFGETWHRQGNLTNKQNVFDDFAAVLRHMIDRKYTSPDHLAIQGGSNGGLLMGAALTQFPSLFNCAISYVGIYDMLRVELAPNGAFNIPEFGTVKNPEQFRALYAYSPYHNVKDGAAYPATLFLTGANDPRVDPMHSRKMTARLQAATHAETPILLRTSADSGHGGDTALRERIDQAVDAFAFLFNRLGVRYNHSP